MTNEIRQKFITWINNIQQFLKHDMWVYEWENLGQRRKLLIRNIKIILMVGRWDVYEQVRKNAQALTFNALLAIVPLFALILTLLKGFGGWTKLVNEKIKPLVISNVTGQEQDALSSYFDQIVGQINNGAIGGISIIILAYSVIALLMNIEESINEIFGVKRKRRLFPRFLTYWSLITLTPLLIIISTSISKYMRVTLLSDTLSHFGVYQMLLQISPFLATWIAITAVYKIVPYTRVSLGSAMLAGLVAGGLWHIWRYIFTIYAANAVTTTNLYGSLAAVPLFILWLYISWLLLLFGAKLTYAFQNSITYRPEEEQGEIAQREFERLACRTYLEIVDNFHQKLTPLTIAQIVNKLLAPMRLMEEVLSFLERAGLIEILGRDDKGDILVRVDPETITPWDIVNIIRKRGQSRVMQLHGEMQEHIDTILEKGAQEEKKVLNEHFYLELVNTKQ